MIDHVGLEVRDYRRSKDFYAAALAPLGFELAMEFDDRVGGFAHDGKPWFWIREGEPAAGIHVAFTAPDTDTVDAFYAAAMAAGRAEGDADLTRLRSIIDPSTRSHSSAHT